MEAANVHRETLAGIDASRTRTPGKRAPYCEQPTDSWPTESLMPDVFRYKLFPYEYEGTQKQLGMSEFYYL